MNDEYIISALPFAVKNVRKWEWISFLHFIISDQAVCVKQMTLLEYLSVIKKCLDTVIADLFINDVIQQL